MHMKLICYLFCWQVGIDTRNRTVNGLIIIYSKQHCLPRPYHNLIIIAIIKIIIWPLALRPLSSLSVNVRLLSITTNETPPLGQLDLSLDQDHAVSNSVHDSVGNCEEQIIITIKVTLTIRCHNSLWHLAKSLILAPIVVLSPKWLRHHTGPRCNIGPVDFMCVNGVSLCKNFVNLFLVDRQIGLGTMSFLKWSFSLEFHYNGELQACQCLSHPFSFSSSFSWLLFHCLPACIFILPLTPKCNQSTLSKCLPLALVFRSTND